MHKETKKYMYLFITQVIVLVIIGVGYYISLPLQRKLHMYVRGTDTLIERLEALEIKNVDKTKE